VTLKHTHPSLAHAVRAGVGTALITAVDILWFKEPASTLKIIWVGLIVIGVVGLGIGEKI